MPRSLTGLCHRLEDAVIRAGRAGVGFDPGGKGYLSMEQSGGDLSRPFNNSLWGVWIG